MLREHFAKCLLSTSLQVTDETHCIGVELKLQDGLAAVIRLTSTAACLISTGSLSLYDVAVITERVCSLVLCPRDSL